MTPKRAHVLIFLLILVAIAAIFYFKPTKTIAPDNGGQTATTTATGPSFTYTTKTITENNAQQSYSIKASYPMFDISNGSVEKKINDNVALLVNQEVVDYKSSSEADTLGAGEPAGEYGTSTFEIDSTVTANQNLKNILPIKFDESFYSAGAAHPGETFITANYNLQTGNKIDLSDLFKSGSSYLEAISAYSIKALETKLGSDATPDEIESGAAPQEKNFAAFLVTDQGLHIIFNEYQVAAYASGSQEITIPWSALSDILNPSLNLI